MRKEKKDFYYYIKNQFMYGGQKYTLKGSTTRESTDDLFDDFGKNWLIGTLGKYVKRFKNTHREKDPLKIGTYMYIMWLKRGFHIDDKRRTPIDTNLQNKQDNFDTFLDRFVEFNIIEDTYTTRIFRLPYGKDESLEEKVEREDIIDINSVYDKFKKMASLDWTDIKEKDIFYVFRNMKNVWERNFSHVEEHDLDTYNEEKNEGKTDS